MSTRPMQVCSAPGCRALTDGGKCEAHRIERRRQQDTQRGTSTERGYDVTHRRIRSLMLAEEPLCRECATAGRITVATESDHIVPMGRGGDRWAMENRQPLCHSCHSAKTMREQNERSGSRVYA